MVVAEKKIQTAASLWIVSPDSSRLISFLQNAFGAEEVEGSRIQNDQGKITHVEVQVDDSTIMMFDAGKSWPPTPAFIRLTVNDCEKVYNQAVKAGARIVTKPTLLWSGDKICRVADPFGNIWWLQEHTDEITSSNEPSAVKATKYVEDSLNAELAKRTFPSTL